MTGILVDTTIIIDFLRQKDKSKTILLRLEQNQIPLYASIITHTECFSGKSIWERKEAREALEILFSNITILTLDENISKGAGEIRAKDGKNIADAIIASTALFSGLELATLNVRDFEKIENLKIFKE